MKTIVLVRHGKSSWEYDVSDAERPLKSRGVKDAKLVAKHFAKENLIPKYFFSSPAKRALDTCKIFVNSFDLSENSIKIDNSLYDFGGESVVNFVKSLPNDINYAMIFGHNHAYTSIANIFGDKFIANLPTSGLVKMNFEINDWKDLKKGKTELIITPKQLKE
ncbi:SixA phosphatase family protein [Winogradskyella pulchriflava]|uniref:Histidine phosphatase family protein n=1 Tax=Winogradskyella pulchriflava TaxID=1110688 RepID=A0ABV6QDR3_9FLAO